MATGISALSKTLIGVEALAGATTDAPTTHWRGTSRMRDKLEQVFPPERVGKLGGTLRSYIPRTGGEVTLEGDASFEQLPYIFNAAFYGSTETTDSGSSVARTWTVQGASSDLLATTDLYTLVVQTGDNIDVETARFCFVKSFVLSGKQGEAVQLSAALESRAPSTSTGFTAVGDTDLNNTVETMLFSKVMLYIDPSSDTIGTTQASETVLEASLACTSGWVAIAARDGRTDFSGIKRVDDELLLTVTFEHNSVAIAEKNAWRNKTERALRLEILGNALATTDTYSTKLLRMNLYGKWQQFGAEGLEEQDGDNIYRGVFRVGYSAIAGAKASLLIVNETNPLP